MYKKQYLLGLIALLSSASAFAAEGFNVGVDVGTNSAKSASIGYNFTPVIGVEVAYDRFGDYTLYNGSISGITAHDSLTSVDLVGTKNVAESLEVFGKVGRGNVITTSSTYAGGTVPGGTNGVWVYGVGVNYRLVAGLGVRVQIKGVSGSGLNQAKVKNFETVGLTYSF